MEMAQSVRRQTIVVYVVLSLVALDAGVSTGTRQSRPRTDASPSPQADFNLQKIPFKIVFETFRGTRRKRNWDLYIMNADGSDRVNLTDTVDVDEMYPHVSPDGTKICFVTDEGTGRQRVRSVYYMNIDGSGRTFVAADARQPCWSFDSKSIAYLKSEYDVFSYREYATSELMIYDLETQLIRQHPNKSLHHIYAICWSPYGRWFVAAVHGGMGYSDTIIAFEASGTRVFDLGQWGVKGCRPDLSSDGKAMVWGETDWNLRIGDVDLSGGEPRVTNIRETVSCPRDKKLYHVDISPDGQYITFSHGPFAGGQQVGGKAKGWNICVGDLSGRWVKVTTDGLHNKEPDWVPIRSQTP